MPSYHELAQQDQLDAVCRDQGHVWLENLRGYRYPNGKCIVMSVLVCERCGRDSDLCR